MMKRTMLLEKGNYNLYDHSSAWLIKIVTNDKEKTIELWAGPKGSQYNNVKDVK